MRYLKPRTISTIRIYKYDINEYSIQAIYIEAKAQALYTYPMNKNSSSRFSKGSIVRYKHPDCALESKARFVVVEDKGDRVNIYILGTNLPYPPIECVSVNDIVVADDVS